MSLVVKYKKKVNKIITSNNYHYVCIHPTDGLKSFEQFKFLIKKCMRDLSKYYNQYSSSNHLKYVSVVEVNKSITKHYNLREGKFPITEEKNGQIVRFLEVKNDIDEMGYHTHIFFEKNLKNWEIESKTIQKIITNTFTQSGITIDYQDKEVIDRTPHSFVNYHTKQFHFLNEEFIVSNMKPNPKTHISN